MRSSRTTRKMNLFVMLTHEDVFESCNPVDLVQIHFGLLVRNEEDYGRKTEFGLTWEMGENRRKMGENGSKMDFGPFFPVFRPFLSHSLGEAISMFRPFSSPLGLKMYLHQVHGIAIPFHAPRSWHNEQYSS